MPITLDARRSFVRQCTCLSVWLARRLVSQKMAFRHALTICTNVYRFTTLWNGKNHPAEPSPGWRDEKWERLLDELDRIDANYPPGNAPPQMEAEVLEFFWPWMEGRLQKDVDAWPAPGSKPFGFFNYHTNDEHWAEGKIDLHLNNPFAPASPFDDLPQQARDLAALLLDARRQCPRLHTVSLQSWLAGIPPLQSLFLPQFTASASAPSPLAYHLGWWGQMIDRAGDFHQRNGQHLRDTGQFRYPCITCVSSIDSTLSHLRKQFGVEAK